MAQILQAEPVPLRIDEGGTIRVGNSRVTLDVVVEEYENGASVDELARAFDTLDLADVLGALSYYLRHREEVAAYLRRREEEAEAIEQRLAAAGMTWLEARQTLSSRRNQTGHPDDTSPGQ